ncbi:MAG: autoinducer binding domain-containing protein [Alphaproteobacteria bacterium]
MEGRPYPTDTLFEFLKAVEGETDFDGISAALVCYLEREGLGGFSLRIGDDGAPVVDGRPLLSVSTYPEEWERHFHAHNYFVTSPVYRFARLLQRPFNWFEVLAQPWISKVDRRPFEEANEFGIGFGVSIPIHTPDGREGVFTATSDPSHDPTADMIRTKAEVAHLLGLAFFEITEPLIAARQHAPDGAGPADGHANDNAPPVDAPTLDWRGKGLTVFERDCLAWGAVGLTDWVISERFRFPEAMVRCALESARIKLGAGSRTHAVVKAIVNDLVAI